jgi:hypothetical protein
MRVIKQHVYYTTHQGATNKHTRAHRKRVPTRLGVFENDAHDETLNLYAHMRLLKHRRREHMHMRVLCFYTLQIDLFSSYSSMCGRCVSCACPVHYATHTRALVKAGTFLQCLPLARSSSCLLRLPPSFDRVCVTLFARTITTAFRSSWVNCARLNIFEQTRLFSLPITWNIIA